MGNDIRYRIVEFNRKYIIYSFKTVSYKFGGMPIEVDVKNWIRECNTEEEALETIRIIK